MKRIKYNNREFNINFNLNRMMGTSRNVNRKRTSTNQFGLRNLRLKNTANFNYNVFKKPTTFTKLFNLKDSDRDGVANIFDCQPHNKYKQDVKPNVLMMQRLEKLPIFVTTKPVKYDSDRIPRKIYHITSKEAPKSAKRRFHSIIKKYPEVVGDIERKKPRAVLVSTGSDTGGGEYGWAMSTSEGQADKGLQSGQGAVIVRAENIAQAKKKKFSRYDIRETAGTMVHELEHVRQKKAWEGKTKLTERMKKGRYSQRREEVLAREAEIKLHKKRPE